MQGPRNTRNLALLARDGAEHAPQQSPAVADDEPRAVRVLHRRWVVARERERVLGRVCSSSAVCLIAHVIQLGQTYLDFSVE